MGRNYYENRKEVISGDVYCIKVGDYYKIGATRHLYSRLISLQTGMPAKILLIHKIKSSNMYLTEKLFQAMFERNDKLERGEWFTLSNKDITYIKTGRYSKAIMDSIGIMDDCRDNLNVVGNLLAM